jgi:capsular polysaccharide export protein
MHAPRPNDLTARVADASRAPSGATRRRPPAAGRAATPPIVAYVNMAPWKRSAVSRLSGRGAQPPRFTRSAAQAVSFARAVGGAVAVWASRAPDALEAAAVEAGVPLAWIEDGFIRSGGLGAECRPPASITLDWRAPHYDPRRPSDLETLLAEHRFRPSLLARADRLAGAVVAHGVTKYNLPGPAFVRPADGRRHVLVAGQVEDDASFRLGAPGLGGNLDLLRQARRLEPEAVIHFRPHPDVEGGHRRGRLADAQALRFADSIVRDESLPSLLGSVDAVHVATSLTGFEALLRGREVVVHGQPFYAGWGLTRDLAPILRRQRRLTLSELVAAALILYPRYLDPLTRTPCTPERLVARLASGAHGAGGALPPLRRLQGGIRRLAWIAPRAAEARRHG